MVKKITHNFDSIILLLYFFVLFTKENKMCIFLGFGIVYGDSFKLVNTLLLFKRLFIIDANLYLLANIMN